MSTPQVPQPPVPPPGRGGNGSDGGEPDGGDARSRLAPPTFSVPNAEKYVLEADALRRRQLRSALLHGSRRTWREHRRIWPAVVAGLVVAALVVAAIAVASAVSKAQEQSEDESSRPPARVVVGASDRPYG